MPNLIHQHIATVVPLMQKHTRLDQVRFFLHPNYQAVLEHGLMTAVISLPTQMCLRYADWQRETPVFNPRFVPHLADTKHYPLLDVQCDFELTYEHYLSQLAPWEIKVTPLTLESQLESMFQNTGDLSYLRGFYEQ